ncbi:hypothetical protein GW17_00017147 [Ensete ventricosum]|nr:hypothetical protein GW17_00017147 [Ensete ventricosum]RZR91531.1 hypothetical protein BHM03_00019660 [Ensete ventricosum]
MLPTGSLPQREREREREEQPCIDVGCRLSARLQTFKPRHYDAGREKECGGHREEADRDHGHLFSPATPPHPVSLLSASEMLIRRDGSAHGGVSHWEKEAPRRGHLPPAPT